MDVDGSSSASYTSYRYLLLSALLVWYGPASVHTFRPKIKNTWLILLVRVIAMVILYSTKRAVLAQTSERIVPPRLSVEPAACDPKKCYAGLSPRMPCNKHCYRAIDHETLDTILAFDFSLFPELIRSNNPEKIAQRLALQALY